MSSHYIYIYIIQTIVFQLQYQDDILGLKYVMLVGHLPTAEWNVSITITQMSHRLTIV